MRDRLKKREYLMSLAVAASHMSEDPYVQVGAVVVRSDWTVIGTGYNGAPPGVELSDLWNQRDARRPYVIHAEMNAVRYATPDAAWAVFTTHIPCTHCLTVLASYSIREVHYLYALDEAYDMVEIMQVAAKCGIVLFNHTNTGGTSS